MTLNEILSDVALTMIRESRTECEVSADVVRKAAAVSGNSTWPKMQRAARQFGLFIDYVKTGATSWVVKRV